VGQGGSALGRDKSASGLCPAGQREVIAVCRFGLQESPSLLAPWVLIRLLHQPGGSCHTRERDIKGRPGCHTTYMTLGGPAGS